MVRKTKFIISLILFLLIWGLLVYGGVIPLSTQLLASIKALPGYLLMVFGCYSLYSIGYDLWILKEFPEDHKQLLNEIQEAKQFYVKKGVKLD